MIEAYGNSNGTPPIWIDAEIELVNGVHTLIGIDVHYANIESVNIPSTDVLGCSGQPLADWTLNEYLNEYYDNIWSNPPTQNSNVYNPNFAYSVQNFGTTTFPLNATNPALPTVNGIGISGFDD